MNQEVYVVNTCNEWKEYTSFRLVGVYNNLAQLQEELWQRFLKNELNFQGEPWSHYPEAIREEWESRWNHEEATEKGLEAEIFQAIQKKKDALENEFKQLDAHTLHAACDYISIQVCTLNEVY